MVDALEILPEDSDSHPGTKASKKFVIVNYLPKNIPREAAGPYLPKEGSEK